VSERREYKMPDGETTVVDGTDYDCLALNLLSESTRYLWPLEAPIKEAKLAPSERSPWWTPGQRMET
jgi:hypothetical protein